MAKSKSAGADARPSDEEIAQRAYELYLQRGSVAGHETDDWLQAEAELIEARRNARAAFGQGDGSGVSAGSTPESADGRKTNGRRENPAPGRRSLRQ